MQEWISHFGYFGVFLIVFSEAIGIPFPAETTLTLSGIEWTKGVFHLFPLWLAACLGNIVGSTIAYGIGMYLGRPIILYVGKYFGITEARLNKANDQFEKYELWIVIFAKFIAGIRILVPYLAGINRMPFWLFAPFNALSAVVWSGLFIIAGHYIGVVLHRYQGLIHQYLIPCIILLVVLIAIYVFFKVRSHRRERRLEAEAQAKLAEQQSDDETDEMDK